MLAELVSRDARGDASGQVCGILMTPSASNGVLVGYLDFDLVKAALMPETMTGPHLGPMWDRSVKVWVAKSLREVGWEDNHKGCSSCEGTQNSGGLNEEKEMPAAPWHNKRVKWEIHSSSSHLRYLATKYFVRKGFMRFESIERQQVAMEANSMRITRDFPQCIVKRPIE